jgi:putative nucleotidyltransferase with HDIG domain
MGVKFISPKDESMNVSPDIETIKRQFRDLNTIFLNAMGNIAKINELQGTPVTKELVRVVGNLKALENNVDLKLRSSESQLSALMGVGRTINSSLGLEHVLSEVMDTLVALMHAERGFLMLREADGHLKTAIARGLNHSDLDTESFALSRTIVEQAARTGEVILTTNAQDDPRFEDKLSVALNHLQSILCAPLKVKDELIGVIYVDNRVHVGIFAEQDKELIKAFADQAAVAIDSARLFDNLQRSNAMLEKAYEATLEGWVRALDLRDKETEGHTQRVTTLTRTLAAAMGVDDADLVHITRGALLHDIGKMGIPDSILHKPGSLTDDERAFIRKHPDFAHQMLSPIEFLRPALDIPYCHHEKWDGTGYPRGLKGNDIPFPARMFTIVDVWDALVSDRPYRKAMAIPQVREHIRNLSEKDFDPKVVNIFLRLEETQA